MTIAAAWVFPLIFGVLIMVAFPLIRGKGDVGVDNTQQREARRQEILQELADVDLDLKIGRITQEDFDRIKSEKAVQLAQLNS